MADTDSTFEIQQDDLERTMSPENKPGPKEFDEPHRWEVEPHPWDSDFDMFVTDDDYAARDAILHAAEMHLWDGNDGEERTLRVTMNKDIPAVNASRAPVVAPQGEGVLQVLSDLRGHFGPSNCWCDAEGDAPHLYCCTAARKLVERLSASPSPSSPVPAEHLKPMCADPDCWVCNRMAELHLASSQYGWTKRPASTPERPRQIFDAGFAATSTPVEQECELERVLSLLISYGAIHTVKGVTYPDGSHAEALKTAERIRDRLRATSAVPATPSPSLAAREAAEDGEAFPWGTVAIINGEQYWLNQCLKCAPTGQPTYHVIKGEPQPSLNDMMNGED